MWPSQPTSDRCITGRVADIGSAFGGKVPFICQYRDRWVSVKRGGHAYVLRIAPGCQLATAHAVHKSFWQVRFEPLVGSNGRQRLGRALVLWQAGQDRSCAKQILKARSDTYRRASPPLTSGDDRNRPTPTG